MIIAGDPGAWDAETSAKSQLVSDRPRARTSRLNTECGPQPDATIQMGCSLSAKRIASSVKIWSDALAHHRACGSI